MGIGLVVGFGLNALNVMSFLYFIYPYLGIHYFSFTFLAARLFWAKKGYPEAEKQEKNSQLKNIAQFQQAKRKKIGKRSI